MIVVDSNVLAARVLVSDATKLALLVEAADNVWLVPHLWRYEFLNILATQLKAGRIKMQAACHLWRHLAEILGENEKDPPAEQVLDLVARHRITAYDAHFVALAQANTCLLVTEDIELQQKFPLVAVSMHAFLAAKGGPDWVRDAPISYGNRTRATRSVRKPKPRT